MTTPEIPGIPQLGEVIAGRYRVASLLGRGGGGVVYRAQQLGIQRDVAIKLLPPENQLHAAAVRRFEREARLVSRLRHPNTVTLYEFNRTQEGMLYIVMEYVEGVSLKEVLQREGQVDPSRTVHIVRQMLKSLSEAHSLGIIHRDLKPANIMLCNVHGERDFVKVLDFGVATVLGTEETADQDDMTRTADVVGTPKYMAPEQFRADTLTPASDLYSIACILFEMLAGYCPFDGETLHVTIARHLFQPPPRLPASMDAYPGLVALVDRLLLKQHEDRYQKAEEVLEALAHWDKGAPVAPSQMHARQQASYSYVSPPNAYLDTNPPLDRTPQPGSFPEVPKSGELHIYGEESARYSQQQIAVMSSGVMSVTPSRPIYASTPSQPGYTSTPSQPVYASTPSQPVYAPTPSRPAYVPPASQPAYPGPEPVTRDTDPSILVLDAPPSSTDRRRVVLVVMAAVAVLLAIVAAALLMLRPSGEQTAGEHDDASSAVSEPSAANDSAPPGTSPAEPLVLNSGDLDAALSAHFTADALDGAATTSLVAGVYQVSKPKAAVVPPTGPKTTEPVEAVERVAFEFDYRPPEATVKVKGATGKCAEGVCRLRARLGGKVTISATAEGRTDFSQTVEVTRDVKVEAIRLFPKTRRNY